MGYEEHAIANCLAIKCTIPSVLVRLAVHNVSSAAIWVLIGMEDENQKREHAELRKPPYERNPSPRVWPLS